jgi:hypothetical protein
MLQKFPFPVRPDNMPVPAIPIKYELMGSWQVKEDDLKYLCGGPLLDQSGDILVPAETKLRRVQRLGQLAAPFFVLTSAIIGIIVKFPELLEMFT